MPRPSAREESGPREAGQQNQRAARAARLPDSYDRLFDTIRVRTAYRCRAYPGEQQQQVLNRTFGCVRVVWNRTLAARHARWQAERESTSYAQADAALTLMKKDPDLAFLTEVSRVPLQQALRHQRRAFTAFFERKRARYPRFKSRRGRPAAHYTRRAFTMRSGELRLAKTAAPLRFTWSWPGVEVAALDPTMVVVSRGPDGRWYVTFTIDTHAPEPLEPTGHAVGVDLGVTDFAVTSDGEKIANPRHLARKAEPGPVPAAPGPLPEGVGEPGQGHGEGGPRPPQGPRCPAGLPAPRQHRSGPLGGHHRDRGPQRLRHDPQPAPGPRHLECGWGEFRRQLQYKCGRSGRELVVIDRWYPSSRPARRAGACVVEPGQAAVDVPVLRRPA